MKENFNQDIDKKIKHCLNYTTEKICVPDDMLFKIRANIRNETKSRNITRKLSLLKVKTIIAIGILCIAITIPCVGKTSDFHWFSQDEITSENGQLPTADKVEKDLGYLPKYAETLKNGFKVKSFKIIDNSAENNDYKHFTNTKIGEFEYAKDGFNKNQSLKVIATKVDEKYFYNHIKYPKLYKTYGSGIQIYWGYYVRKDVPNDYVETKDELKFTKYGLLDIVYGANEINVYHLKYVLWYVDGIEYAIVNNGYDDLSLNEMIDMAADLIGQ